MAQESQWDSEIKFECRLLLAAVKSIALPTSQKDVLFEIILRIIELENNRLKEANSGSRI